MTKNENDAGVEQRGRAGQEPAEDETHLLQPVGPSTFSQSRAFLGRSDNLNKSRRLAQS